MRGMLPQAEVAQILTRAYEEGVRVIDTAPSYGVSEEVLGTTWPEERSFRVVTKTPLFRKRKVTSGDAEHLTEVFLDSLDQLKQSSVYGLLIHHADDLLAEGGERLWDAVTALKQQGLVTKIGVSFYCSSQIDRIVARFAVDLVQVPLNVLDQRLVRSGHLKELAARGVEIHSRSVFLQGILLADPARLHPYFAPIRQRLDSFHLFCDSHGLSRVQAALAFCAAREEVACVLAGVSSQTELEELIQAAGASAPDNLDFAAFACDDERYVNPA